MLVVMSAGTARGQTTAFTYQGQLSDAGALANGSYDLRFALFDSTAGGAQIGSNQDVPGVPVKDGVFTVQLDFGVNAFPGANRFVEIGVKPAGSGSFTTLAPRQQISSSPYAIRTLSAATADALSSACVGCVKDTQIQTVAGSKVSGPIPAASLPTGSGNYIQNTTAQQASSNFNICRQRRRRWKSDRRRNAQRQRQRQFHSKPNHAAGRRELQRRRHRHRGGRAVGGQCRRRHDNACLEVGHCRDRRWS